MARARPTWADCNGFEMGRTSYHATLRLGQLGVQWFGTAGQGDTERANHLGRLGKDGTRLASMNLNGQQIGIFQVGLSGHNQAMHQAVPELMQEDSDLGTYLCSDRTMTDRRASLTSPVQCRPLTLRFCGIGKQALTNVRPGPA